MINWEKKSPEKKSKERPRQPSARNTLIIRQNLDHILYDLYELVNVRPVGRLHLQTLPHDLLDRLTDHGHVFPRGSLRSACSLRTSASLSLPLGSTRLLIREPPVAAQDAHAQTAAGLLAARLEGALADEAGVQGAPQGPDVDLGVDDRARLHVEELRGAVRHRAVFCGGVLDRQGEGSRGDGDGAGRERAEVHEDGRPAIVCDHDVACISRISNCSCKLQG